MSQIATIRNDLKRIMRVPDFTDQDFGKDVLNAATDGVLARAATQVDPDGVPWPELSSEYADWKSRHYPGKSMGHLEEIMLDRDEVAGAQFISVHTASMHYGKSGEAMLEAEWFQEGRSDPYNQPPRPFYGISDAVDVRVNFVAETRFARLVP